MSPAFEFLCVLVLPSELNCVLPPLPSLHCALMTLSAPALACRLEMVGIKVKMVITIIMVPLEATKNFTFTI